MHYEVVEPSAIYEYIDGEVLALNLLTGIYVQMKSLSAELFHALASGHSAEIVETAAIMAGYGTDVVRQFETHYSEWVALGLLRVRANSGPDVPVHLTLQPGLSFSEEQWDDLSELIMMDPVHDVSPQGWPARIDE